ncbi:MAG: hypothetical protein QOG67_1678 [Verrucomicrobiota bacterium]
MKRLFLSFVFLLCAINGLSAEWRVSSVRSEASGTTGVEHRHLDLEDAETGRSAAIELALFSSASCRLRVVDNGTDESDLATAMHRAGLVAGVNGGYFDPNFAPLGLRIIDGKPTARLTRGRLMSGVLASNGSVQILRLGEFSRAKKINAAVECGPMIVDLGNRVAGLEATRTARRTFAAVERGNRAALGFCSGATLAELASVLTVRLGDFKVQRALNLDGGSSSGFWFKRKDGSAFSIPEEKTVRDFVGILAR